MSRRVVLIPGEGIGPQVTAAARRVLAAAGADLDWEVHEAGAASFAASGTAVRPETIEAIRTCGVALKGPLTTPGPGGPYRSPGVQMRAPLGLYAQVRMARTWAGLSSVAKKADLVVIRSLTEDLSAGVEFASLSDPARAIIEVAAASGKRVDPSSGVGVKAISPDAARRLARFAFEYATLAGRWKVTVLHKGTVQRYTDGLFLEVARDVAISYPSVELEAKLVDAACADLVRRPEAYDVLLAPALYGDIASDVAAAVTGGLGLSAGGNFGLGPAVFEAAHGTVPHRAGTDSADPIAMILTGAMLAEHLGLCEVGGRIRRAVASVLAEGAIGTPDLCEGRSCRMVGTEELTDAVASRCRP